MTTEDFYAAQVIESEGWEYLGVSDAGEMRFCKMIGGIVYSADIRQSR